MALSRPILLSLSFLSFFLLITSATQSAQTVIECGGFIRWNASQDQSGKIAYDRIRVNLVSESSLVLKESTEVLPNGAFSVPVYDLNSYRITLSTPKGWIITPTAGHRVDLRSDPNVCSTDVNFFLEGYTVYGQVVTYGLDTGPSGLHVLLKHLKSNSLITRNVTQKNGHFSLAPVLSGAYELTVEEGDQTIPGHARARTDLVVNSDSVVLEKPVILMGHSIRGSVVDFEKRALNESFVYLASTISLEAQSKVECDRVNTSTPAISKVLSELKTKAKILCRAVTDAKGLFSFNGLPGGDYLLIPSHSTPHGNLIHFTPSFIQATVAHSDITLGEPTFRADGLQLTSGQVLWPDGTPITSAKVWATHDPTTSALTDGKGFYQLGPLKPGTHVISVEVDGAQFLPIEFSVDRDSKSLPTVQPTKISICGRVELLHDLDASLQARVVISNMSSNNDSMEIPLERSTAKVLRFCSQVAPGKYNFKPHLSIPGNFTQYVHVVPGSIEVQLRRAPTADLVFSQFRAKITGRVVCLMEHCIDSAAQDDSPLVARLQSTDTNAQSLLISPVQLTKTDKRVGQFTFDNLLPGNYKLYLMVRSSSSGDLEPLSGWCWESQEPNLDYRLIQVRHADLDWTKDTALQLVQLGYLLPVRVHSPLRLSRVPTIHLHASSSNGTNDWEINEWNSTVCVPSRSSSYHFTVQSPCLGLKNPQPNKIRPTQDCHHSLDSNPAINLTVLKVPLFVRFTFKDALSSAEQRTSLTKQSIVVDVHYTSVDRPVDSFIVKWSSSNNSDPVAEGIFWLPANHAITLKPRPSRQDLRRWYYTYLLSEPHTVNVNPQLSSPEDPTPESPSPISDCHGLFREQTVQFNLDVGVVLRGRIDPPVPKVEVKLFEKIKPTEDQIQQLPLLPLQTADNQPKQRTLSPNDSLRQSTSPLASTLSNLEGFFSIGPVLLPPKSTSVNPKDSFTLHLSKPGYEFVEDTVTDSGTSIIWFFKSTKLSLVEVLVREKVDQQSVPLQGVLVSIIGEGHRGNLFTDDTGVANFVGLAPGQYYIRAMMKEYSFTVLTPKTPSPSQATPITVKEGVSARVELDAKRVAYSTTGVIHALGGLPLSNVTVEALWMNELPRNARLINNTVPSDLDCELKNTRSDPIPREQAISDSDGVFRIRGLLPGCHYAISVLSSSTATCTPSTTPSVHHATPSVIHVRQPKQDLHGLVFVTVPHLVMSTLTVNVNTEDQFLPSLRLTVFPLDRPDLVIVEHNFSTSWLFRVPVDKMCEVIGRQIVVRLDSSLDHQLYTNVNSQQLVLKPKMDHSEHHTFNFKPMLRSGALNTFRSEL